MCETTDIQKVQQKIFPFTKKNHVFAISFVTLLLLASMLLNQSIGRSDRNAIKLLDSDDEFMLAQRVVFCMLFGNWWAVFLYRNMRDWRRLL